MNNINNNEVNEVNYMRDLELEIVELKKKFTNDELKLAFAELAIDIDNPTSRASRAIDEVVDRLYTKYEGLHDEFCGIYITFEDLEPKVLEYEK